MHKPHPHEHAQRTQYLYVRVVKAKDLLAEDDIDGCDCYVEVRLGNYMETTRPFTLSNKNPNPEWNQVFAFIMDKIEATMLEVTVKDTDVMKDDFMGCVLYDLCEIPKRVKPDSPLVPVWYRLVDRKGEKVKGELMFAVWWGTQDDEAFPEAISGRIVDGLASLRSKVYQSPRLWYLRVNVIVAQDLILSDRTRCPEVCVKEELGFQALRTRVSMNNSVNPMWNEYLMFVAAEPFEDYLVVSVEDRVAPAKDQVLGRCVIPLRYVYQRFNHKPNDARWFKLERNFFNEEQQTKQAKFASMIRMRICLEGGYHVFDESTHYSSDYRPVAKQLWKPSGGILELGILSAQGLLPMKKKDGRETTDAYCVVKYGPKWVRTRTIINSFSPKWNEQYSWQVFDPCTVITIGVFDNFHLQGGDSLHGGDTRIGKVRIRVSTLETGRIYNHWYPLLVLRPSGVKRMGEINLAVRFTCTSLVNMMHMYSQPLLPDMHYICPIPLTQLDSLRHQAANIVSMRLSRAEQLLRKEIVKYMLDADCDRWSMRRIKVNFLRIQGLLDGLFAVGKWFRKNPINTVVIHMIIFTLAMYPELIMSSIFFSLFVMGVWNYRRRPMNPPHMNTRLSCANNADSDELDEEFDTFPTSHRPHDIITMRYDRLRSQSGRIQRLVGDLATQGERLESLISWRDPIATSLFVMFCLIAAIVLYATPFYVVFIQTVIYVAYHQNKQPSVPINFFRRLPARTDIML